MHNLQVSERRKINRIPTKMAINIRNINGSAVCKANSIDLTPFGVQIESDTLMNQEQYIELWPDLAAPDDSAHIIKGWIKWVKPMNGKCKSGVSFDKQADWPVNLSDLTTGYSTDAMEISLLNSILTNIEDGILIIDQNMHIIGTNPSQPFCPHIKHTDIIGKSLDKVSDFLDIITPEGSMKHIIKTVFETGKTKKINPVRSDASEDMSGGRFNYLIKKIMLPGFKTGVIIRARQITQFNNRGGKQYNHEEKLWLKYKYITLEQLMDGLIEDIANPLSAAVGRLDLMTIRMQSISREKPEDAMYKIDTIQSEINTIQSVLMQVTEFCRAAIRRRKNTHGGDGLFSINTLIDDELKTMELHSQFRSIKKNISLTHALPLMEGDYSDWVNAFVALCQAIIRKVSTLRHRELAIKTYEEDGANVLSFTHNGKALSLDMEKDRTLTILKLLQEKYNANISIHGSSGNQTITIKTKPADNPGTKKKERNKGKTNHHAQRHTQGLKRKFSPETKAAQQAS